jgi:hypothetical protein
MDAQLEVERRVPATRERRLHDTQLAELPDGAFVLDEGVPLLVRGRRLLTWAPGGYSAERSRPRNRSVQLITPPSLVEVLRSGWKGAVPLLHPSAN